MVLYEAPGERETLQLSVLITRLSRRAAHKRHNSRCIAIYITTCVVAVMFLSQVLSSNIAAAMSSILKVPSTTTYGSIAGAVYLDCSGWHGPTNNKPSRPQYIAGSLLQLLLLPCDGEKGKGKGA